MRSANARRVASRKWWTSCFEEQGRQTAAGDEETQPYDEDFVRALEHGMPPTSGVGLGIDRLAMVLLGRDSIRDVILFPALRTRD